MFLLKRILCPVLVLATLGSAIAAQAATYYVDPTGNDSNVGTEAQPWATVVKGANMMVAGDTTYVKNGTYTGTVWFQRSGTSSAPIQLLNYPGHHPIIQTTTDDSALGNNNDPIVIAQTSGTAATSWIVISGFELLNTASTKAYNICLRPLNASDIVIRNNVIHDCGQGINGNMRRMTIDRNVFYHIGDFVNFPTGNQSQSIYLTGTYATITNNLIYNNLAYGIQVAGYPFDPASMTDASFSGASNWLIANNTLAYQNNRAGMIVWQPGAVNNTIWNNIFYENSQNYTGSANGIDFYNCGTGHLVQNNLFYATAPGSTTAITDTAGGTSYTASGNLFTSPPLLVNAPVTIPATPDFHLQSGSAARDAGLTVPAITVDFAGIVRPQGAAYDIGAYEYCLPPCAPTNLSVR